MNYRTYGLICSNFYRNKGHFYIEQRKYKDGSFSSINICNNSYSDERKIRFLCPAQQKLRALDYR